MRRFASTALAVTLLVSASPITAQQKPVEEQIAEAVSALPEPMREGATVLAFVGGDSLSVVRMGLNMMICLADDPKIEGFHVACYHRDLEPFMARGRQLKAQGKTVTEVQDDRREEVEKGKLLMPTHPAALYSLTGPEGSFDQATGTAVGARALHVIYVPWATEDMIGISEIASDQRPWLMFPGTPWAHIMIHRP
jgi:hypothetical protein